MTKQITAPTLASILAISIQDLNSIIANRDKYIQTYEIRIKSKKRIINEPVNEYKIYLKKLDKYIRQQFPLNHNIIPYVHGYLSNKSIYTNAQNHINSYWIIEFDIKDFFPSIKSAMIQSFFNSTDKLEESATKLLTQLLTYRDSLPLGFHTSPYISNLIFQDIDNEIVEIIDKNFDYLKLRYSRYADNIFISTPKRTNKSNISNIITMINNIIGNHGFKVNRQKTHIMKKGRALIVCGLNVDVSCPSLPRHRKKWYRSYFFHRIKRYFFCKRTNEELEEYKDYKRPRGRLNFIRGVDYSFYLKLQKMFKRKQAMEYWNLLQKINPNNIELNL